MKLLLTLLTAVTLATTPAAAVGNGLRSPVSSALGENEQMKQRDLQESAFFECGDDGMTLCHTATQDCVNDACQCKAGMVEDGMDSRVCTRLDECATDFPCAGTNLVDIFCEDRAPDNFFFKCNCMPGFIPILPEANGELTVGAGEATLTIPTIDGIPTSFRPLRCVALPLTPAPIPAPTPVPATGGGTVAPVSGPMCTRKCNAGKEECLDDGNPNEDGKFKCTCIRPYVRAPNGDACILGDDSCDNNLCGVNAECQPFEPDADPPYTCVCPTGFVGGAFTACIDEELTVANITFEYELEFESEVNETEVQEKLNEAMEELVTGVTANETDIIEEVTENAAVATVDGGGRSLHAQRFNFGFRPCFIRRFVRIPCRIGGRGVVCFSCVQVIPIFSIFAVPVAQFQLVIQRRVQVAIITGAFVRIFRRLIIVVVVLVLLNAVPTAPPSTRNLMDFEVEEDDELLSLVNEVDQSCTCVFCDEDERCGQLWFGDEVANPQQFTKLHIVVSHCDHDLDWLADKKLNDMNLEVDVTVISKCGKPVFGAPEGSKIIPLPNTGRCDHSYAHYIANELQASEDAVVIFTKDNIGADNIHQVGNWRSFHKMVNVAWNRGFACGIESSNLPVGTTEYSLSTYHDMKVLGGFRLNQYTRNAISRKDDAMVDFESPFKDMNDFVHQTIASATLPERVIPVCYGGLFAASSKNILSQPKEVWASMEHSLSRGNNIQEGHFVERLWAGLLSTPLTHSQAAALVEYSDHVYHAEDSINGALIHQPTIYEAVAIEANSLDTIRGNIEEKETPSVLRSEKPKLYLLVGPSPTHGTTPLHCKLARSNAQLIKDNFFYVGANIEECLGHELERPTITRQAGDAMVETCFAADGTCSNEDWSSFLTTLEYYYVRDHNVILALESLGGVDLMNEANRGRLLGLQGLWDVVPVVTYRHFHELVRALFHETTMNEPSFTDSWTGNKLSLADSFSDNFEYQVSTSMANVNKFNALAVYVTFMALVEKPLPVIDLNGPVNSSVAFVCDVIKADGACAHLHANNNPSVEDHVSAEKDNNMMIADLLAVVAHENGWVHKNSSRRSIREAFLAVLETFDSPIPYKCMNEAQLEELFRVSDKMNKAMPVQSDPAESFEEMDFCSIDTKKMLENKAFTKVFAAHGIADIVAQK